MAIELTESEFQECQTKEGLERVLTKVCALAVEDALRLLPSVVQNLVVQVAELKETSDKFYKDNPQFKDHKAGIAQIIQDLEARNPGKGLKDLMPEVTKVASSRLAQLGTLSNQDLGKPSLETLDYLAGMIEEK